MSRQTLEERILQLGYVKPKSAIDKAATAVYWFLGLTILVASFVLF